MKNCLVYILICFQFFICGNLKAEPLDYYGTSEIAVIIGETKPLSVSNPQEVKIGNPSLLDVAGAGAKELLLSGLVEGETSLTVIDDFGEHNYMVKIYQQDLEKVKERVDILLEASGFTELTTKIGEKERKVFLLGELSSSKKELLGSRLELVKDKIVDLIKYIEDVPTIEIDVEVLEIKKDDIDKIGFTWSSQSVTFNGVSVANMLTPPDAFKILKSPWDDHTWRVTLDFLKQRNKAKTLSRPKLVCLSGKEATLVVGGEIPIISGSTTTSGAGSSTTTYDVELKEYGIKLKIQPTVKENDEIHVNLNVEITDVDTNTQLTLDANTKTPGFKKRSAQTELSVLNAQTVLLAGLIDSKINDNRSGLSGFSSIPILGALFRNKYYTNIDTEIAVILTPTIIRNQKKPLTDSIVKVSTNPQSNNKSQNIESINTASINKQDPIFKYSLLVQNIINSNLKYPRELKEKNLEGAVKLSLHLLSSGQLLGVIIMQSSGSADLDNAAEYTVKRLSPFPAFPSEVKLKELWLEIPIVYKAS